MTRSSPASSAARLATPLLALLAVTACGDDAPAPGDNPACAPRDDLRLPAAVPITHVVVVTQENRSFDHLYGRLPAFGHTDVDGIPEGFTNPDLAGAPVSPAHLDQTCIPADPPHQWDAMRAQWNEGAMDGFVRNAAVDGSDGHHALGWYDQGDLPFYYWLCTTFAMTDRTFSSVLSGTWANRDFLYAGTSLGVRDTGERTIPEARTLFDQLDDAGVAWAVYTDGVPRQDALGWDRTHRGVFPVADFLTALAAASLPPVAFVDPSGEDDEHPPGDMQRGEAWFRDLYLAAVASPLWPRLAIVFTYDESGGLFDHVPPPRACPPSPEHPEFDRLGIRVPLILVSPWARPAHVSHELHETTSITRLIQLLHGLPPLTARDAASDALLDLFDFDAAAPPLETPPVPPAAGTGGCPL